MAGKKELIAEVGHLITNTEYLISYFSDHRLADWRILDAAKLEVFRIIALGITGFDNSLSLNSMEESSVSLESLRDILSLYTTKKEERSFLQDLNASIEFLRQNPDFDSFDRAAFITRFGNRISSRIAQLERDLPGRKIKYNRMLGQEVGTLFDPGAFNVDAFSPGPEFHITDDKVGLGKKLFYDVSLSGTGTRSCASCHDPHLAFTDGRARPSDIHIPSKLLIRNVPTLLNAALQSNYFYDMRALTLEDQVCDVIGNEQEMDGSMDAIIKYVSTDKSYRSLFEKAFPAKTENGIGSEEVANALASYVRSLTKLNSRFDEYMRGKGDALSKQEVKGFNLFMGKAKCATCHFVPLFNGITPPKYVMSETEVLGVPVSTTDSILDPDLGYYDIIGVDSYKHAFKIPTVRNILKTAPYMHNGIYGTLEQVMEFYNNGGGAGLGINLPNQTLSEENLHLSEQEIGDIIAFMKSLESRS
jgi:cytochrome c peroxidase